MINTSFFRTVFLTGMLGLFTVGNVVAQSTLNASDVSCTSTTLPCINWTDSITGHPDTSPALNVGGGYWSQTYFNTTGFGCGTFALSHNSGKSEYSYWSGFTTGSNGDNRNFGFADTTGHAGSINWVQNQWGVMAGGGLTTPPTVVKGAPYFIAYWDYFSDGIDPNAKSLRVILSDNTVFVPQNVWICNHPWPYYGNIFGDGFARPMNQPGDYFDLIIHGVKADGTETTPITKHLCQYNARNPSQPIQDQNWQSVDLTSLGKVQSIYFTMESTDEFPPYGPNTAVYFDMDKLTVEPTGEVAKATAKKVTTAVPKVVEVRDYFPIPSYTGGEVSVWDAKGKEVLKTTVKAGEKINLSKLPAGDYRLRHGHKHIQFKKVK